MRDRVFISYSHADAEDWYVTVRKFLKSVEGEIDVWSDRDIEPGALWDSEIQKAVDATKIAVALVTQDWIVSDYIQSKEMAKFFGAADRGEVQIFWIAVGWSTWKSTKLIHYQAANDPNAPLESLNEADRNRTLVEIATKLLTVAKKRED